MVSRGLGFGRKVMKDCMGAGICGGRKAEMALGMWGLNMASCVASRILEMLAMKGRLLLHMNGRG